MEKVYTSEEIRDQKKAALDVIVHNMMSAFEIGKKETEAYATMQEAMDTIANNMHSGIEIASKDIVARSEFAGLNEYAREGLAEKAAGCVDYLKTCFAEYIENPNNPFDPEHPFDEWVGKCVDYFSDTVSKQIDEEYKNTVERLSNESRSISG